MGKFVFNCTKCGKCCSERGPVPLVLDDLVLWAENNVVNNFMPYVRFIKTPRGSLDLVLSRTDADPFAFTKEEEKGEKKVDVDTEDLSCPLYNAEKKECTSYEYRPMSCRTYPLEYTGEKYQVVDDECPGVGEGEMTKEARVEMKDLATKMFEQLKLLRISMPIFAQAIQPIVLKDIMDQQRKFMEQLEKMPPEQRKMVEEQMRQQQEQTGK